ncbi:hypothetical protein CPT_Musica_053 [Burkholderia phage Musica]|uniref:Uncharacterized protein n=1 Tax=Burkholderia phage Musica TaxID=2924903 RepID=A0AAE9G9P4_9CAUD|nr:hypothetical protein CPT_Musica_053 [Burkholderia phage Musica]
MPPGARSCDPAPPARKNEWFLCTHALGTQGRPARAARRSVGRFFYALSCALIMQVGVILCLWPPASRWVLTGKQQAPLASPRHSWIRSDPNCIKKFPRCDIAISH